ncbi:hypothetical protein LTR02_004688 [Friedmanniomyces endolithicus]|nr:hypothetical protein LTR94_012208 [Friedmanniomyces endolithicus]KAK0820090.1 hypothetical protein LTR75_001860 [Friedmanniomyces endolithicus]KAK0908935.1 hypothetical protein LTR02_004688 [Friedmanniomyces endolithicus]KAK0919245.1 hypothetical protein LTR57_010996 [Friedmanniomyces endolithicus]KAK1044964.1 hypothetical protein LTS16_006801 [Friedmanniomyces endolithicus]
MRSFIATALVLFAASSVASVEIESTPQVPRVLEYNIDTAYSKFTIPCPLETACSETDESLVFELQLSSFDELGTYVTFTLNDGRFQLEDSDLHRHASTTGVLSAYDTHVSSTPAHRLEYSIEVNYTLPGQPLGSSPRGFTFEALSLDDVILSPTLRFHVALQLSESPRLAWLSIDANARHSGLTHNFTAADQSTVVEESTTEMTVEAMVSLDDASSFDLDDHVESLHLLEAEAEKLKEQILLKKQAIAQHLRTHRDHVSLSHLLEECDGLVCAARTLAQRLCDKISVLTEPSPDYARPRYSRIQTAVALSDEKLRPQQASRNCTKSTAQGLNMPLIVTKNGSTTDSHMIDLVNPPDPLVRALALIATVLGLAALCKYIRQRCMSMRTRVERAADREERRNARAYRKAARRAAMRRRWDHFMSAVSCFRSASEPRMEDYEEKRALVLQDAFLEQMNDLDQAEKGEIMEAEIRELRHAHEIVASLVRVNEQRYDLVIPVNDPPPPLVPLPFTPASRSRASTGTLPSYTSESLPDYSWRPETLVDSSTSDSLVDGFAGYTPTSTNSQGGYTPPSTASSAGMRYTPTSSILDMSTRPSGETMRTRESKDLDDA